MNIIYHCKWNPNRSLLFSSSIHFILELNCIHSDEVDLHEAPKVFDKVSIKLIRYYPDDDASIIYFTVMANLCMTIGFKS